MTISSHFKRPGFPAQARGQQAAGPQPLFSALPWLKPDMEVRRIAELTPERLRQLGDIYGVIFDLDDTLARRKTGKIGADMLRVLKNLQRAGLKMGILSNNNLFDYARPFIRQLQAEGLDIPYIAEAGKPFRCGFRTMQRRFDLSSQQIAVVGDNPVMDIFGARHAGMKSVRALWFPQPPQKLLPMLWRYTKWALYAVTGMLRKSRLPDAERFLTLNAP